jgi:hypothetical protein
MAAERNMGSALSLGRLGLGLGNGHTYSAAGTILGLSLGTALVIATGALIVVGLTSLVTSGGKKRKVDQPQETLR